MAHLGILDDPRFWEFQYELELSKYEALGCLETLWHYTAKWAPDGHIGRYGSACIEPGLGWQGEKGLLVAALLKYGWLKKTDTGSVVVGDWEQHSLNLVAATRNAVVRKNRERIAGGYLRKATRNGIFERDSHRCCSCQSSRDLTIDHKQPISHGGSNDLNNLQTLCRSCNSRKKDRAIRLSEGHAEGGSVPIQ